MNKTILITGSTDGIGLVTAKSLIQLGHTVIIHGRNESKLAQAKKQLSHIAGNDKVFAYKADLSVFSEVNKLAANIKQNHKKLDVLINNAGVFIVPETLSKDGLDTRFVVNTLAPYLLTKQLILLLGNTGRVINLSSAAQSSVAPTELTQQSALSDSAVYAKSKLALTMWSMQMARALGDNGPVIVAVNPKSFLGSKMVEQAYGVTGDSLEIGADILVKAAISGEFAKASGRYFDNDIGQFASPHQDALNANKTAELTRTIEELLSQYADL